MSLKVFLLPCHKKDWQTGRHQSFFLFDTHYDTVCQVCACMTQTYSRCHTKRRIGTALTVNSSFGMTTSKFLKRHIFAAHGSNMLIFKPLFPLGKIHNAMFVELSRSSRYRNYKRLIQWSQEQLRNQCIHVMSNVNSKGCGSGSISKAPKSLINPKNPGRV